MAHHSGNERFRALIQSRSDPEYCGSYSLNEKKALAEEVVRHIEALDPPGRFLKRTGKTKNKRGLQGPWEVMSHDDAVKKARQALRDCNRPDRVGYAKSVSAPADVLESALVRKSTGLSQQQYAQQLAAATNPSDASTSSSRPPSRRGSGRRTPSPETSSKADATLSPAPPSPVRSRARNINSSRAGWVPDNLPISGGSLDLNDSHDASQDTPTLMNANTPTTAATSSGFFSAEVDDFAHGSFHPHHDIVDVSHAPGLDSPTHTPHFGHLPESPVHGTFEEALASIHSGEEDSKPLAVHSFGNTSDDPLREEADAAALNGTFEGAEEFVAAFGGDDHNL